MFSRGLYVLLSNYVCSHYIDTLTPWQLQSPPRRTDVILHPWYGFTSSDVSLSREAPRFEDRQCAIVGIVAIHARYRRYSFPKVIRFADGRYLNGEMDNGNSSRRGLGVQASRRK